MKGKAILVSGLALLMLLTFVAPVLAAPANNEQKVPVSLKWTPVPPSTTIERRDVDTGISHRILLQNWAVKMYVDDAVTPLEGAAVVMRETIYRYSKDAMGVDQVVNDYYDISFLTTGGGFEGNAHIMLTDYVSGSYNSHVHALLHGTEAYEGMTLNAEAGWGPGTMMWEGYILKW
jgi:hypothetical protein